MTPALEQAAALGGKGVGLGLTALAIVRLFQWVVHLACSRLDKRQETIDKREARVDASLAKRLAHLEQLELVNRDRIAVVEQVATILIAELRSIDPANGKLHEVAVMLRMSVPMPIATNPTLEESMDKLRGMK